MASGLEFDLAFLGGDWPGAVNVASPSERIRGGARTTALLKPAVAPPLLPTTRQRSLQLKTAYSADLATAVLVFYEPYTEEALVADFDDVWADLKSAD
jgi:hypothetical protein